MIRMHRIHCRAWFVAAAVVLFAACSDGGQGPPAGGTLMVSLTTAAAGDHGVQLTVRGPALPTPAPARSSYQVYWHAVSATEGRVIVLGPLSTGSLLTLQVPDVSRVAQYSVEIEEVAQETGQLRANLDQYGAVISRQ